MKAARRGFRTMHREDRLPQVQDDSYRMPQKLAEWTTCPDCSATYVEGRWRWTTPAARGRSARCPACRRIRDGMPAGTVRLEGDWFAAHRREVLTRAERCEAAERKDHPLQRIMKVEYGPDGATLSTTDVHLARRIGQALRHAFKGALVVRYAKRENQVRVSWTR